MGNCFCLQVFDLFNTYCQLKEQIVLAKDVARCQAAAIQGIVVGSVPAMGKGDFENFGIKVKQKILVLKSSNLDCKEFGKSHSFT